MTQPPTTLELFAAFAAQLPLLSREDLAFMVEAMRGSSGFRRMMDNAREQAAAIGLSSEALERPVSYIEALDGTVAESQSVHDHEVPSSGRRGFYTLPRTVSG